MNVMDKKLPRTSAQVLYLDETTQTAAMFYPAVTFIGMWQKKQLKFENSQNQKTVTQLG